MTGTPVINPPKHVAGTGAPASEAAVVSLVEGIAKGDTAALGVFYEEWFDRAFDLTRTLTGRDESFCLDVVQDAMMKVIRKLRPALGITTRAALDAWFARVVHTTAIDQLRREARRRRRELGRTEPGAHAGAHASADELAHLDERIKWVAAEVRHLDSRETSMVGYAVRAGSVAGVRGRRAWDDRRRDPREVPSAAGAASFGGQGAVR